MRSESVTVGAGAVHKGKASIRRPAVARVGGLLTWSSAARGGADVHIHQSATRRHRPPIPDAGVGALASLVRSLTQFRGSSYAAPSPHLDRLPSLPAAMLLAATVKRLGSASSPPALG
jgi:hypothetical protein